MSNTFGKIFKITTFGESHQKNIGVVIDGCPSNIKISEEDIKKELYKRRPKSKFSTSRVEKDSLKILSGVFKGKTTGAPICILIDNSFYDKKKYEDIKNIYRPSHGNFTYHKKYNNFDLYGGGRASARETAARCAASFLAKKILEKENIKLVAFVERIKDIEVFLSSYDLSFLEKKINKSSIFCPCEKKEKDMLELLEKIKKEKDSVGGVVRLLSSSMPIGLGEPIYDKLSSRLASGFFSIPGVVGVSIGKGFSSCDMKGSEYNDLFDVRDKKIVTKTNNSGGILAGISSGMPLDIKVFFKPTPTIGIDQDSVDFKKKKKVLDMKNIPKDICIAIRGSKVVEAMANLVVADFVLLKKCFL